MEAHQIFERDVWLFLLLTLIQTEFSIVLPLLKRMARVIPPITRLTRGGVLICVVCEMYNPVDLPMGFVAPMTILMALFNSSLNPSTKVRSQHSTQAAGMN